MPCVIGIDLLTSTRLWSKIDGGSVEECWIWTASRTRHGYGQFSVGGRAGRMESAHSVTWRLLRGEIPDGLELDHLCRVRACCNPWHLEPVSHRVNGQRGVAGDVVKRRAAAITHCPHGHRYDEANTQLRPTLYGGVARLCRACGKVRSQARRDAKKVAA